MNRIPAWKVFAVVAALVGAGCGSGSSEQEDQLAPMANSGITTLQKNDVKPGTGAEARPGMTVRVHYTGWLYDASKPDQRGTQFDSSVGGEPFELRLGAGDVIPGWDEGIAGMKTGGTRILTIPPAMAYGSQSVGGVIPPNATLLFEVSLLDVK